MPWILVCASSAHGASGTCEPVKLPSFNLDRTAADRYRDDGLIMDPTDNRSRVFTMLGDPQLTLDTVTPSPYKPPALSLGAIEINQRSRFAFLAKFHLKTLFNRAIQVPTPSPSDRSGLNDASKLSAQSDAIASGLSYKNGDASQLHTLAQGQATPNNSAYHYVNARTHFYFELERRHPRAKNCWLEYKYTDSTWQRTTTSNPRVFNFKKWPNSVDQNDSVELPMALSGFSQDPLTGQVQFDETKMLTLAMGNDSNFPDPSPPSGSETVPDPNGTPQTARVYNQRHFFEINQKCPNPAPSASTSTLAGYNSKTLWRDTDARMILFPVLNVVRKAGGSIADTNEIGFIPALQKPTTRKYILVQALQEMAGLPLDETATAESQQLKMNEIINRALSRYAGLFFDSSRKFRDVFDLWSFTGYPASLLRVNFKDLTDPVTRTATDDGGKLLSAWNTGLTAFLSNSPTADSAGLEGPRVDTSRLAKIFNGGLRIRRDAYMQPMDYENARAHDGFVEDFCGFVSTGSAAYAQFAFDSANSTTPKSADSMMDNLYVLKTRVDDPTPGSGRVFEKSNLVVCGPNSTGTDNRALIPENDPATYVRQAQIYCHASFLLAHKNGRSFHSIGNGYQARVGLGEIDSNPPEAFLDLGDEVAPNPQLQVSYTPSDIVGPMISPNGPQGSTPTLTFDFQWVSNELKNKVALRKFTNADIYVNLTKEKQLVQIPKGGFPLVLAKCESGVLEYRQFKVDSARTATFPPSTGMIIRKNSKWATFPLMTDHCAIPDDGRQVGL